VAGLAFESLPLQVLLAPYSNHLDNRTHSFSVAGETVLNPRRDLGIDRATDQSLVSRPRSVAASTLWEISGINRRSSLNRRVPESSQ